MSSPSHVAESPLTDRRELVEYMARGARPREAWRIGTEHEKFGFRLDDLRPPTFDGERGIEALLQGLTRFGWTPVHERIGQGPARVVALTRGDASVTLEPAGQLELSGAQLETIHQTCCEVDSHLGEVKSVADTLGLGFLGMGFQPKWRRQDMPWMPKGRYAIMLRHMPRVGNLGLDMMLRTCTIQVNLDYASEADMAKKFRVGLALQPLATALFANSPFTEGKPNGYLSYRSHIWSDTDPARTGMLPFVFEDGFGYERYLDYALDVPMYFVYRDGKYIDAAGQSFRDFLKGELPALPGEKPRATDWTDHLSTAFPEVRLKSFLEMRGADGGRWSKICALPAFWVGLLYDSQALGAAWDEVKHWSLEERQRLRDEVPKLALNAVTPSGETLRELGGRILDIAAAGLGARNRLNAAGDNESGFLDPLRDIVARGTTPAELLLARYHGEWGGDVRHIYEELSF
jgi:glutamate--cysteine ligase